MEYAKWRAAVDNFVAENAENIARDIKRLVDIPSVEQPAEEGAPFGTGPKQALAEALKIAREMGLETGNAENYMGWAEVKGRGDKTVATITHLDVVPAGNGWDSDPFCMERREGWLIGRGVSDDKGPSVLCLYVAKFLKEQGITPRHNFRVLLGCNEETGMQDVEYYLEHFDAPDFCFSPDAEFPVCNGEKGGFNGEIVSPRLEGGVIADFAGGVAVNAVPDRARCAVRVPAASLRPAAGLSFHEEDGLTVIEAHGKSGHAATPESTVNAIGLVVSCLLDSGVTTPAETAYLQVLAKLFAATDGSALGIAADDGLFTPLTIIGGTMKMDNGRLRQSFDCRYPTNTDAAALTANMTAACGSAAKLENVSSRVPFYIDANSPAIRTLIDTYNDVTGEQATPFTMGGGTYARHFPYAVSFGPEHADMQLPDFAGPMHGANEGAEFEKLIEALKIYILALLRLQEVEL